MIKQTRILPILFSTPMVQAIRDDRKTQTRRVAKLNAAGRVYRKGLNWHCDDPEAVKACPYGGPGDILWVRETWGTSSNYDPSWYFETGELAEIVYRADGGVAKCVRWTPSIHMPFWACRLFLRVTEVRVQRVQAISDDDCFSEGIDTGESGPSVYGDAELAAGAGVSLADGSPARHAFHALWNSINAKRGYSWEANPWVWASTFERIAREEVERIAPDEWARLMQRAAA